MRTAIWTVLLALPLCSLADPHKIGSVREASGRWCRNDIVLRAHDPVYLDDDIRYCGSTVVPANRIVIRFDRKPPYDRAYRCETPGICDHRSKLWLVGAYRYGPVETPPGAATISPPAIGSLVPDTILEQGATLPVNYLDIGAHGRRPGLLCRARLVSTLDAPEDSPPPTFAFDNCSPYKPQPLNDPGTYALFLGPDTTFPVALIGVVRAGSVALADWQKVPINVRANGDPVEVAERRAYLLDIVAANDHHRDNLTQAGYVADGPPLETPNNEGLIALKNSGASRDEMLAYVREGATTFDISSGGLIQLVKNGVPSEVIQAIQKRMAVHKPAPEVNSPVSQH